MLSKPLSILEPHFSYILMEALAELATNSPDHSQCIERIALSLCYTVTVIILLRLTGLVPIIHTSHALSLKEKLLI